MTAAAPVWLYTLSLNQTRMLGFFFRHYDPWVDRYIIYDDGSTDETLAELARRPNVELRRFARVWSDSFVESARVWQNNVWKESRGQAAWVVVTAIDEHIHHLCMSTTGPTPRPTMFGPTSWRARLTTLISSLDPPRISTVGGAAPAVAAPAVVVSGQPGG